MMMEPERAAQESRLRWRYAPLLAWLISSLSICVPLLAEVLTQGFPNYLPRSSYIVHVVEMLFRMTLLLAVVNWGFVALFFVVRRNSRMAEIVDRDRALERADGRAVQGQSVASVKTAMGYSLGAMLIPTGLLMLLIYYMEHFGPQGRGSGVGAGITIMAFLALQFLVQPILGLIGWFAGRGFYRFHSKRQSGFRGVEARSAR